MMIYSTPLRKRLSRSTCPVCRAHTGDGVAGSLLDRLGPPPPGIPSLWIDAVNGKMITPEGSPVVKDAFRRFPGAVLPSREER